jgi:hypothetical protein
MSCFDPGRTIPKTAKEQLKKEEEEEEEGEG